MPLNHSLQPNPDVRRFAYFESEYLVFHKDRVAGWRLAGFTGKKL